jgi:hypothetical protein
MLRRRISIKVEHTEVTITVTEIVPRNATAPAPENTSPPELCPDCGAPWLPNFREAVSNRSLTAAQLQAAASQEKLHLFCSSNNEIWICERSLQHMKEKF